MKKHSFYALLAFAAFFAVLSACGDGDIVDVSSGSSEYAQLMGPQGSLGNLVSDGAFIDDCSKNANYALCQQLRESLTSSSSGSEDGESSSSETDGSEDSSSSVEDVPSSSSADEVPSSSSELASSSSVCNIAACIPIPEYTCSWSPATVVLGGSATININITGDAENCETRAYVEFSIPNALGLHARFAEATIPDGEPIQLSGTVNGDTEGTFTWPTGVWPTGTSAPVIRGSVICSIGGVRRADNKICPLPLAGTPSSSSVVVIPSSSSVVVTQSSSSRPSSSSVAPSSSSRPSSSSVAPSSSSRPSSSSVAPSSSSRPSSSSVAPSSSSVVVTPSSSSTGSGSGPTTINLASGASIPPGNYIVGTSSSQNTCQLTCEGGQCTISGGITASANSGTNGGSFQLNFVGTGTTFTLSGGGTIKVGSCW